MLKYTRKYIYLFIFSRINQKRNQLWPFFPFFPTIFVVAFARLLGGNVFLSFKGKKSREMWIPNSKIILKRKASINE